MIRRMPKSERSPRYAVVMAGGAGTRFWPRSRRALPKQFLSVRGRHSLLQDTVRRLDRVIAPERILVVAAAELVPLIRKQLPAVPASNVVVEPSARGTAACLALAAARLAERDPEAVMAVFPADHVVGDVGRFRRTIVAGFRTAETERCLVTFGISPTRAETGYGYIELGSSLGGKSTPRVHRVAKFHEKPNRTTAESYLRSGRYLWNSGMFVWRVDVFRQALESHAADIARAVAAPARLYRRLAPVSIDVALLERAERVAVVRSEFRWSDVGDWPAMADVWGVDAAGNASRGETVLIDCHDTVVYGTDRLVAVLGADDLVIVDSPDALLVCTKSRAQEVRRVVDALARGKRRSLL